MPAPCTWGRFASGSNETAATQQQAVASAARRRRLAARHRFLAGAVRRGRRHGVCARRRWQTPAPASQPQTAEASEERGRRLPRSRRSGIHRRVAEVPDRPHRLHQAARAGRHARVAGPHREPARTGECGHGLARPRRDAERVPRSCRAGQRCRRLRRELAHHADDAARGQGTGVPAGFPDRAGGGTVSAFAHAARARRHRGRAPPVLRRHDPRHGHAHPVTRARYRRRYGTDMPEPSVASRFLEEVPQELLQDLGSPRRPAYTDASDYGSSRHYSYEDEDQRPQYARRKPRSAARTAARPTTPSTTSRSSSPRAARSFRGQRSTFPQPPGAPDSAPDSACVIRNTAKERCIKREGDGEDAKITVQFPKFGLKKLVEKYAQLEKA